MVWLERRRGRRMLFEMQYDDGMESIMSEASEALQKRRLRALHGVYIHTHTTYSGYVERGRSDGREVAK